MVRGWWNKWSCHEMDCYAVILKDMVDKNVLHRKMFYNIKLKKKKRYKITCLLLPCFYLKVYRGRSLDG